MSPADRLRGLARRLWRNGPLRREVAALACVAMLSWSLWSDGTSTIDDSSSTLMGIRELVSADSEHYLAMADAFREGDFSMPWLAPTGGVDRAHRQPGYPAVLAAAGRLGALGAPDFAALNVAFVVVALWVVYAGARVATGSALAALLASAVVYDARFLMDIATRRLLVEPLYVAVCAGAVGATFAYLTREAVASLLLAAALAAAAYLVRVNGLFLAASLAVVAFAADWIRYRREDPEALGRELFVDLPWPAYAGAFALFALLSAPSWLPRYLQAGEPFYHGYLSNYLWVDDYERAHQPGAPRFTFATYAAEHSLADAGARAGYGLRRVFVDTPRDKFGTTVALALAASFVVVVALADIPAALLLAAAFLQALPLVWTALPNPVRRIPAAALLPFAAMLVAAAAAALLRASHDRDGTHRS